MVFNISVSSHYRFADFCLILIWTVTYVKQVTNHHMFDMQDSSLNYQMKEIINIIFLEFLCAKYL